MQAMHAVPHASKHRVPAFPDVLQSETEERHLCLGPHITHSYGGELLRTFLDNLYTSVTASVFLGLMHVRRTYEHSETPSKGPCTCAELIYETEESAGDTVWWTAYQISGEKVG